jgi:hypothetical protein
VADTIVDSFDVLACRLKGKTHLTSGRLSVDDHGLACGGPHPDLACGDPHPDLACGDPHPDLASEDPHPGLACADPHPGLADVLSHPVAADALAHPVAIEALPHPVSFLPLTALESAELSCLHGSEKDLGPAGGAPLQV